jgi:tRNA pseudouridine55 synthase
MDGILIIDKPEGITSHDVVARVRRILKTRRVGHTGTLDPFANGVMVILVGRATRLAQFLDKDEKEYEAVIKFGFETDTGDRTGVPKEGEQMLPQGEVIQLVRNTNWEGVLVSFLGPSDQTPPMYSAKKIDGKKLYEHARRGETVERKAGRINISVIKLIETGSNEITIRVACSAGTYIRTLAEEIGRAVGIGAHLDELRRTRAGRFDISEAVTLEQLAETEDASSRILPLELAVSHLPEFILTLDRIEKTRSGLSTRIADEEFTEGAPVRMLDPKGYLVAIGLYDESENSVRPRVVLI